MLLKSVSNLVGDLPWVVNNELGFVLLTGCVSGIFREPVLDHLGVSTNIQ
jgi:hypothetical protein